jgi:hypothetical protein
VWQLVLDLLPHLLSRFEDENHPGIILDLPNDVQLHYRRSALAGARVEKMPADKEKHDCDRCEGNELKQPGLIVLHTRSPLFKPGACNQTCNPESSIDMINRPGVVENQPRQASALPAGALMPGVIATRVSTGDGDDTESHEKKLSRQKKSRT